MTISDRIRPVVTRVIPVGRWPPAPRGDGKLGVGTKAKGVEGANGRGPGSLRVAGGSRRSLPGNRPGICAPSRLAAARVHHGFRRSARFYQLDRSGLVTLTSRINWSVKHS